MLRMLRLLAALGLFAAMPAWSDALPAARTAVSCTDVSVVTAPTSCTHGGASALVTEQPFAGTMAHVQTLPLTGAGAFADLHYSFEVVGGQPNDIVPVLVSANLTALASSLDHAEAFASLFVHTGLIDAQVCADSRSFGSCVVSGFTGDLHVTSFAGDAGNTIELESTAGTDLSFSAEFATAFADPLIRIDPAFANAAAYSIVVSPGVANALPVPEPASWALLAIGVGALSRVRARTMLRPAR